MKLEDIKITAVTPLLVPFRCHQQQGQQQQGQQQEHQIDTQGQLQDALASWHMGSNTV